MANARQLEKGKWILQSYKNGMRKTFRGKNRGEVERQERDWLKDLEIYGKELKKDKVTLSYLIYEHLFVNTRPTVSQGTFERYMSAYNTHLKDSSLCLKNIKDIMQVDLQKFINSKDEMSYSSMKNIVIVLNGGFRHALANDLIRTNVMEYVRIPKSKYENDRKIEAFTLDEQNKYIAYIQNTKYKEILITALTTGMRQGELVALKWENVDFNKKIIHVKETSRMMRTYDDEGNASDENVTCKPKTAKSIRDIPINSDISSMLMKLKLKNGATKKDFVFIAEIGEGFKNDTVSKMHKIFCKKASVKCISFHCLRHTFATRSIELGVNVKTLSEILGHSDVSITLNRYVHSNDDNKREAIEKISKLISTL